MKKNTFLALLLYFGSFTTYAQFHPPVGQPGTSAMYKDSSAFVDWATACTLKRGYQDISDQPLGYANVGDETMALGKAGSNAIVSLGDGGSAVLEFSLPIANGPGYDFAVFENGFDDLFLELAFVEVSSDGINFFRFPATSNTDTTTQTGSFGYTDATKINNLAGKYRALYGTPFDLDDIPATSLLNPMAISYIKIVDVVGSIQDQYCSRDQYNHKVNDPWPTAFGSGGFDLDAVGVIHNLSNVGLNELELSTINIYPNPAKEVLYLQLNSENIYTINIYDSWGSELFSYNVSGFSNYNINLHDLSSGIYTLEIKTDKSFFTKRFLKSEN